MNPDDLHSFLQKHVRPYDPETDDYERPPFAADIKEGKNDPIYNAHSYHTKVPPRSIIPYIMHYTQPGDLVLDLFCGSGMTGVAAQMCANPPADILESFPELKERVGPRACILNDLSPAACHIAYNYNTPVDVEALKREFERIKAAVQEEFDWLYGTEHYEPAVDLYHPANADVASRLKNPPASGAMPTMLGGEERTWELLTKEEVEARLGYPVTELPRDEKWGDLDVAKVEQWLCIPATIQYTIWSDVYRCEGFVTIEEPTGKVSTRGKNAGKAMVEKRRVARGCGRDIVMWHAAVDTEGEVSEVFSCPACLAQWKKMQLRRQGSVPVVVNLTALGLKHTKKGNEVNRLRRDRKVTAREFKTLSEIAAKQIPYWVPDTPMDPRGPQYRRNALQVRKIEKVTDFWSNRNLWAYASLWERVGQATDKRVGEVLRFGLTGITAYITKKQSWGSGGGGLSGQLYLSSFPLEKNVMDVFERKVAQLVEGFGSAKNYCHSEVSVRTGSATKLPEVPSASVDYVFTDPPFGSNIYYSEPNLLWEAWLGKTTDTVFEAVVHRKNDGGTKRLEDYACLMQAAFQEMFRILKPGRWATIEFNNSDGAVFEAIKQGIRQAGFEIVNMLLLDKEQKTFKQVKGAEGVEDVVDKDVLFNLHKPAVVRAEVHTEDRDFEQQLADAVRQHLQSLPERIKADPAKYNEEHRTTATINSMLMNALIPRGVSVERLNLPFIERVCSRYFRKIGQRWYLRGEAVGGNDRGLVREEVAIKDELTAIAWLRQKLESRPALIGELKPLWMRATGLLPATVSQSLDLDRLLIENFWRDAATNRWREPTADEREKMNDDRSLRVLHDADRLVTASLDRSPSNAELCDWIKVLFDTCKEIEEGGDAAVSAHRGFDKTQGYQLIVKLSHRLSPEGVEPAVLNAARKQASVAGRRLAEASETAAKSTKPGKRRDDGQTVLDLFT